MSDASEATQFKLGNQAWKARSSHGRKPIFSDPDVLYAACEEYFQWSEDNPIMVAEPVKFQGAGTLMQVPKLRAMTMKELFRFIGISAQGWYEYKAKPDFSEICTQIEDTVFIQKFQGAAADQLNPSIIARELGLADKTEVTTKEKALTHIESEYVDP